MRTPANSRADARLDAQLIAHHQAPLEAQLDPRRDAAPSLALSRASEGLSGPMLSADQILAGLDPEQRAVAEALSGPVCVLAGAGTGKTRAITHRIAYGVASGIYVPQRVLAVTFTSRSAGQMRVRLRELGVAGVQARTFHAAALRQLSYFWPQAIGTPLPRLQEHKAPLVADAAARLRLSVDRAVIRDLAAEIEWAKVSMISPVDYAPRARAAGHEAPNGLDLATVSRLLEVYEDVKTDRGVIDFEDVLILTLGILQENPAALGAVREQYRHFVVDEYQDVNTLQQRLLELWLGSRRDVCVVGDPRQTIYTFTGASPGHLTGFEKRYPDTTVVRLVRDYRSTPQVVTLANRLMAHAKSGLDLVAQRPAGPTPGLSAHDDDLAEASAVAARVGELIGAGVRVSEIAILYRTNGQSEPLEQALSDRRIAYLVRGGERFFARKEVRDALMLLRGAAHASESAGQVTAEVRNVLASAGWTPAPPPGAGAVRERWESLQALVALADDFVAGRAEATMADFVAEVMERAAAQHAPTVEGVTLASLHAAKGLEWDAVFIVGVSDGLLPISLAQGAEAIEEERRLLYVGVTRAREHLHLSFSRSRTPGGRASRHASRFLDGLFPETAPSREARSTGSRAAGVEATGGRAAERSAERAPKSKPTCRTCASPLRSPAERKIGRCAECPATYDEVTFDRLRAWRSETAGAAKVPAYVVFTDATLVAIAEAAPTSLPALARIAGVGPTKLERYGAGILQILGLLE